MPRKIVFIFYDGRALFYSTIRSKFTFPHVYFSRIHTMSALFHGKNISFCYKIGMKFRHFHVYSFHACLLFARMGSLSTCFTVKVLLLKQQTKEFKRFFKSTFFTPLYFFFHRFVPYLFLCTFRMPCSVTR